MQSDISVNTVNTQVLCWLAAGITLAILPHGLRMPLWILPLTLTLILWRLGAAIKAWPMPGPDHPPLRWLKVLLIVAGFIGVYLSFHTLVGREAGSALLVILAGFKILETRYGRDVYIASFLGFFVIVTNFFVTETMTTAFYMLATLVVMFTALIIFNDPGRILKPADKLKTAGGLLLQALPVMLILFLLFPRINGPLWGLPQDAYAGKMGIDDEMAPGTISRLVQSNAVAFRAEFEDAIPPNSRLYWRGPVLWYNDGYKWTRERVSDTRPAPIATTGKPVNYSITLEPTSQRWLFALEMPAAPNENGYLTNDFQLRTRKPVNKRIRYALSAYPEYRLDSINSRELRRALQLPPGFHKKTLALAQSWQEDNPDPASIIERALAMFAQENFFYTLTPLLLTGDNVDDFLFNTRQGFCEHYAGAFVVLMRAAGIPARVVAGYQGGSLNPVGDYFVVRQRDAHAWGEVWIKERGWVRIDPTSAVSPARVEQGIGDALPDLISDVPAMFNLSRFSRDLWNNLRNIWDAANNQWIQWVITYGPDRQALLLKKFGVENINLQLLSLILLIIVGLMFVIIAVWLFRQREPVRDPARAVYDRFCGKIAATGIRRLPSEGPLDFARRAGLKQRALAAAVDRITALYVAVRYGGEYEKFDMLKNEVRNFRPAKILKNSAV